MPIKKTDKDNMKREDKKEKVKKKATKDSSKVDKSMANYETGYLTYGIHPYSKQQTSMLID